MKRLRKSEIRDLAEELPVALEKRADVQLGDAVILVDGRLWFFRAEGIDGWVPALPLLLETPDVLPHVVVDMGAVGHVVRGADVMRPGITELQDFHAGDVVLVVDETHQKPLMVGQALLNASEIRSESTGKVVRSLHYVGDALWNEHVR